MKKEYTMAWLILIVWIFGFLKNIDTDKKIYSLENQIASIQYYKEEELKFRQQNSQDISDLKNEFYKEEIKKSIKLIKQNYYFDSMYTFMWKNNWKYVFECTSVLECAWLNNTYEVDLDTKTIYITK